MLKGYTNLPDFKKQLQDASKVIGNLDNFISAESVNKIWRVIRPRLIELLNEAYDEIQYVHVSSRTTKSKQKMKDKNIPIQRHRSGAMSDVVTTEPWAATETMKRTIKDGLKRPFRKSDIKDGRQIELAIDVGDLIDSDDDGYPTAPYPITVDKKLMSRTGGEIGILRLNEKDMSVIAEMLVRKSTKLFDEVIKVK